MYISIFLFFTVPPSFLYRTSNPTGIISDFSLHVISFFFYFGINFKSFQIAISKQRTAVELITPTRARAHTHTYARPHKRTHI